METIRIETAAYNDRRYGKPWIARVDFNENKKGEYIWGEWVGSPGSEGILEINVTYGDIVAQGQKDNRKPRNSAPTFFVVNLDGSLGLIGDKGEAYKHYLANKDVTPDVEELKKEKERLLKRLAEIENILGK